MNKIKLFFNDKGWLGVAIVCLLMLSVAVVSAVTGNTYAANTNTCVQCKTNPVIIKAMTSTEPDGDCAGGYFYVDNSLCGVDNGEITKCWSCIDGSGFVTYASQPNPGFKYSQGNSFNVSADTCVPGFNEVLTNNCSGSFKKEYQVTYLYYDGGTNSYKEFKTDIKFYGEKLAIINDIPSRGGAHSFLNWNTSLFGDGESYVAGDYIAADINTDITLYAMWKHTVTLTLEAGEGATINGASSFSCDMYPGDDYCTVPQTNEEEIPSASKSGFDFVGWDYLSGDCSNPKGYGSQTKIEIILKDTTLKACWSPKSTPTNPVTSYTVSYNANGGSGEPATQTKTKDVDLTLSSTKPTRSGYTFQGWGTSATDTTVDYTAGAKYTKNESITLYAIWKLNEGNTEPKVETYTVSYNVNGGSGEPATQTKTKDVDLTLSSTKPTRSGYTFQGWGTSATDTTVDYESGAKYTKNESITLYAIWKLNESNTEPKVDTYTVSYNANGGNGEPATQTKTKDVDLTLSSTKPTRSGYTFQGWGTSATDTTVDYTAGAKYTKNESIELYAVWNEESSGSDNVTTPGDEDTTTPGDGDMTAPEDDKIGENVPTGSLPLILVSMISLGILVFGIYYYNKIKGSKI